ncbi:PIG-L deacetylase family protein [Streptomyces sp. NPDC005474]|uniref:PIG-L deacetylase family protein n=1 Tax=Streptomyces sp. NPDC005474 TaxID=3154878 RepID=UPI00345494A6
MTSTTCFCIVKVAEDRGSGLAGAHMWERVLAVGAHPDDIEFGCGGALLRHAAAGASVTLLVMSDGARGGDPVVRAGEQARVGQLLGAKVVLLGLPDTHLGQPHELISLIETEISASAPDLVYTHLPEDMHQDHVQTHQAVRVAARNVANVLLFESPHSPMLNTGIGVNISSVIQQKTELLAAHASQVSERRVLTARSVRSRADRHGTALGCDYAEMFYPLRFTLAFERVE